MCFFGAISVNIGESEAASECLVEGRCGHETQTDEESLGTALPRMLGPSLLPIEEGLTSVVGAKGREGRLCQLEKPSQSPVGLVTMLSLIGSAFSGLLSQSKNRPRTKPSQCVCVLCLHKPEGMRTGQLLSACSAHLTPGS